MAALPQSFSASRGAWLPLAVSVALHALAFSGFFFANSAGDPLPTGGFLPVDTLVVDDEVRLSLALPATAAARPGPAVAATEEQAAPPIIRVVGKAPSLAPVSAAMPRADAPPTEGAGPGGPTRPAISGGPGAGFLQAPAQCRSVVYVIDRSVSMGLSGALVAAKQELLASLHALPAVTRFQVILYNRHAAPLQLEGSHGLLPATDEAKQHVTRLLAGVRAEGGTAHQAALLQALALRPDVIFFVTDADDLSPDQVRTVTRLNHGRAVLHAVELGPRRHPRDGSLAALARANGGTYRAVDVLETQPPAR